MFFPLAAQLTYLWNTSQTELYRFLPTMLGVLNEPTVENKETIRNAFRSIIPISDIHASTNLPKSKPEEMSAADLLVLLHEDEKKIGVSAAKEGEYWIAISYLSWYSPEFHHSHRHLLHANRQIPFRGFSGRHAADHRFGFPADSFYANGQLRLKASHDRSKY